MIRIIGLTGGIASGKSEVAKRFLAQGIPVVDADKIGHAMIAPGGPAEAQVRTVFGEAILSEGAIDRGKLGKLVFNDPALLQELNALVHPKLFEAVRARCLEHSQAGAAAVIVDAALLGDAGVLQEWLSGLVLVLAPISVRMQRLMGARGMTHVMARSRIKAQVNPESKRVLADWIIDNDGSLDALHARVDVIAEDILRGLTL